jgi:Leucine-rich repeat (LRR) protein
MLHAVLAALVLTAAFPGPTPEEEEVIAAVIKLGGKAVLDEKLEPIARVDVTLATATDATLVSLSKLPNVGAITIADATRCTEPGFEVLRELPDLQKLILRRSAVTDRSAAAITAIRPLQELYLGESRITDAGLAGLKGHKHLRVLDLYQTAVTDKSVAILATVSKLEDLNLSGTKVTDKGLDSLAELKNLKLIRLHGTGVTRAGVSKLEAALPKATVRW